MVYYKHSNDKPLFVICAERYTFYRVQENGVLGLSVAFI